MPSPTTHLPATSSKPEKLYYIDNIRIVLTLLVVLHHACVMYGASGGWYYKEATLSKGALIPMTIFVSLNQSFFMGFFFMLAAIFTYSSYRRKTTRQFVTDRLVRLGLPLVFYSFVFSPFLSFLVYRFGKGNDVSFWQYLGVFDDWIDFGVLWFVAALLLFTLIYVVVRKLLPNVTFKTLKAPGTKAIMTTALIMGIISFIVRTLFPVGWTLKPLGFQLGHFTQYIFLFAAGLLTAKNDWLAQLSYRTGKQMLSIALLMLLFFPVFYVIREHFKLPIAWYSGGFNVLSLLYAVWEQCIGMAIITAFICICKHRWNASSSTLNHLSRRTFAVYILHPLPLVALAMAFRNWSTDPALKLLVIAPVAVIGSFMLASVVVMLPGVRRVV